MGAQVYDPSLCAMPNVLVPQRQAHPEVACSIDELSAEFATDAPRQPALAGAAL
jgi:hypothetical protein